MPRKLLPAPAAKARRNCGGPKAKTRAMDHTQHCYVSANTQRGEIQIQKRFAHGDANLAQKPVLTAVDLVKFALKCMKIAAVRNSMKLRT